MEKKFLNMNEVKEYLGYSTTPFWHLRHDPARKFPKPYMLSPRRPVWEKEEIDKWLKSQERGE